MGRSWRIDLRYSSPPLHANQRFGHWAQKARIVAEVRRRAFLLARAAKVPPMGRIVVRLEYRPRDRRRRDPSNVMPTQKAVLDGVVDAGVVPDDRPPFVVEEMPTLLPSEKGKGGSMWLVIEEVGDE